MEHIKKTQEENPTLMFKDVLKLAGKTYKKTTATVKQHTKSVKKSLGLKKKSKTQSKKSKKSKKSRKSRKSRKSKK